MRGRLNPANKSGRAQCQGLYLLLPKRLSFCRSARSRARDAWLRAADRSPSATSLRSLVFVLGPDAVASAECKKKEVDDAAELNKHFAPVVWREVRDSSGPEALARINRIDFVG